MGKVPVIIDVFILLACLACASTGWRVQMNESNARAEPSGLRASNQVNKSKARAGPAGLRASKSLARLVLASLHPADAFVGSPYPGTPRSNQWKPDGSFRERHSHPMAMFSDSTPVPAQSGEPDDVKNWGRQAKQAAGRAFLGEDAAKELRVAEESAPKTPPRVGEPGYKRLLAQTFSAGIMDGRAKEVVGDVLLGEEVSKELRAAELTAWNVPQKSGQQDYKGSMAKAFTNAVSEEVAKEMRLVEPSASNTPPRSGEPDYNMSSAKAIAGYLFNAECRTRAKEIVGDIVLGLEAARELRLAQQPASNTFAPPRIGEPGYKRSMAKQVVHGMARSFFGEDNVGEKVSQETSAEQIPKKVVQETLADQMKKKDFKEDNLATVDEPVSNTEFKEDTSAKSEQTFYKRVQDIVGDIFLGEEAAKELRQFELSASKTPPQKGEPGYKRSMAKAFAGAAVDAKSRPQAKEFVSEILLDFEEAAKEMRTALLTASNTSSKTSEPKSGVPKYSRIFVGAAKEYVGNIFLGGEAAKELRSARASSTPPTLGEPGYKRSAAKAFAGAAVGSADSRLRAKQILVDIVLEFEQAATEMRSALLSSFIDSPKNIDSPKSIDSPKRDEQGHTRVQEVVGTKVKESAGNLFLGEEAAKELRQSELSDPKTPPKKGEPGYKRSMAKLFASALVNAKSRTEAKQIIGDLLLDFEAAAKEMRLDMLSSSSTHAGEMSEAVAGEQSSRTASAIVGGKSPKEIVGDVLVGEEASRELRVAEQAAKEESPGELSMPGADEPGRPRAKQFIRRLMNSQEVYNMGQGINRETGQLSAMAQLFELGCDDALWDQLSSSQKQRFLTQVVRGGGAADAVRQHLMNIRQQVENREAREHSRNIEQ